MSMLSDIRLCLPLLPFLLLSACGEGEETIAPDVAPRGEVTLNFSADITGNAGPGVRAAVNGDRFPAGTYRMGTWICLHEDTPADFIPSKNGYANLLTDVVVTGSDDTYNQDWKYSFDNRPNTTLNVSRGVPVDIYVFHPRPNGYNQAQRPDSVPFTTGTNDWMWAKATLTEEDMGTGVEELTVPLNFTHAMTCLRVSIKAMYPGSTLSAITVKDSGRRLYPSGYMDLARQELLLDEALKTDELRVAFGVNLSATFANCHIIMPPVKDYKDGEITLAFEFNGHHAKTEFSIPAVMNDGVTVDGFAAGKRYTYELTLDNHVIFTPVGVDDTWENIKQDFIL